MSSRPDLNWTREQVLAVCAGDRTLGRRFLADFTPLLRWQIASLCPTLIRRQGGNAVAQWIDERLGDFLKHLFEKKLLETFDPQRSQLGGYLRFLASRLVISHLRCQRDELRLTDLYGDMPDGAQVSPFERMVDADLLVRLLERFHERVGDDGYATFVLLFLDDAPPKDLASAEGLTLTAIHKRKQRIRDELRAILEELAAEADGVSKVTKKRSLVSNPRRDRMDGGEG